MSARAFVSIAAVLTACAATAERAEKPKDSGGSVHGSIGTRYRGRFGGGEGDQDLSALLALDVGDRDRGAWSGALVAAADLDIDGAPRGPSAFASLSDTGNGDVRERLFEAFVDHRPAGSIERARLGRQIDPRTPVVLAFDGLALTSRELGARRTALGLYGGVPARFDSAAHGGDLVLGAFASARPWEGGRARLDWMHLEDEAFFGTARDDLVALDLRQALGERVDVEGRASLLDGDARDLACGASYADLEHGFELRARFERLLATQNELASELDPFSRVLLAQEPFTQIALSATKDLGTRARVGGGYEVRQLAEVEDEGPFNRDFERAFVNFGLDDLFGSRLDLAVSADRWNANTDDASALSVDLSRKVGEAGRISAGTSYALYDYDLFLLEERDHVRTWYVAWRLRRRTGASFDLRYEHEDAFQDTDQLRAGVTWRF